ncbi:hypothetical protein G9A89_005471 [Geosiphon pyriformis]|nr:hypothetical protein G9A89_005471 [Geosiphon pyriformis]
MELTASSSKALVTTDVKSVTPKLVQVVLDEDTYTEAISEIIKRDYFPSLTTLEAQHGYLDALDAKDPVLLRDATRKLTQVSTPIRKTPAPTPLINTPQGEWDTPISTRTVTTKYNQSQLEKQFDTNMSLDNFQAKYTSEDNASYPFINKAEEQKKLKYKWMYEKEKSPLLLEDQNESPKLIEGLDEPAPRPGEIASWKYTVKNALMFYPEGHPVQSTENTRIAPKQIVSGNTRFESPDDTNINDHAAATAAAATAAGIDLYGQSESSSELGTPRIEGYTFVSPTPSLNPSQIDSSELMTWGMIEGTPLLINGDQTPGPIFSLPPTPRREMLGMNLSSNASRNIRRRINSMSTPRTSSRSAYGTRLATPNARAALLSPAAKKLLKKSHKSYRSTTDLDPQLRSSYGTSLSGTSLRNVPFSPVRLSSPSAAYIRRSSEASQSSTTTNNMASNNHDNPFISDNSTLKQS